MTFRVLYTQEAARVLGKLDATVRERIRQAVGRLAEHPDLGKRLTGLLSDRWSYRVGDWRVLYKVKRAELIVLVLTVGHRSKVYEA